MRHYKRILAFCLTFILIFGMSGLPVFADPDIGGGAGVGDMPIGMGAVVTGITGPVGLPEGTVPDPAPVPPPDPAPLPPAPTPAAVFDGIRMVLKNTQVSDTYSLDGGLSWLPCAGTETPIPGVGAGAVIMVKTPASPTNVESLPQSIQILKPSAPVGVSAVDPAGVGQTGKITGVNSGMEYCGSDNAWKGAPDGNIEGLSPDTYQVRGKGGDNILPGDPLVLTINGFTPVKEQKPNAVFDAASMTLSQIPGARAQYSLDGGGTWIGASGSAVLSGVTAASGIRVVVRGDGATTVDSDVQSIAVSRPGPPSVTAVDIAGVGGYGEIHGVDAGMEYRQAGGAFTPVTGSAVTGLAPGDYEVRYRASGTALAGEIADVTIHKFVPTKEDKPSASFEASTMILSNIPSGGQYSLDGGNSWIGASGSAQLSGVTPQSGIQVKKAGDGSTRMDSDIQVITVTKPGPPAASPIHASAIGGLGGLDNVNANMEFCAAGSGNWQNIGGGQVTGLSPGSYNVRYRAAGTALASDAQTVAINGYSEKKAQTPGAVFDAASMKLSGVKNGMQYSVDGGGSWIPTGEGYAVLSNVSAAAGIRVKTLGDGRTTVDSDVQVIALTQAQPPAVQAVAPEKIGGKGKIVNVNNTMQYRREGTGNWVDIGSDTVHDLEPGRYEVRVKASGTVLAGKPTVVEISSVKGNREATPNASYNAQNHMLSGMREGMRYSTDGGHNYEKATKDGDIDLSNRNVTYKNDIRIYTPGNGVNTVDSDIQVIDIKQQFAPSGVKAVNATPNSLGELTGVNAGMEYKLESDKNYIPIQGDKVTGLKPGTYHVRTVGKYEHVASEPVTVKIGMAAAPAVAPQAPAPQAPAVQKPAAQTAEGKKDTKAQDKKEDKKTGDTKTEDKKTGDKKDGDEKEDKKDGGEQKSVEAQPGTPVLSGSDPAAGWEDIDKQITAAKSSELFTVDMNSSTELPAGTINSLKGSGSKLIMDMGDGVCWAVAGETVDSTAFEAVDLKVTKGDGIVPQELVAAAQEKTQSISSTQFEIAHSGPLGFDGVLAMNLGKDYAGKTANLFYFDESKSQLELNNSGVVDEGGNVSFVLDHCSKYVITVADQAYTESVITASPQGGEQVSDQEATPAADPDINADEKPHKSRTLLIVIIVIVTLLAAGGIFFVVNRNRFLDN